MLEMMRNSPHLRFVVDALVGLAVFCGLTVALLGPSSAAGSLPLGFDQASKVVSAIPPAAVAARAAHAAATDANSLMILLAAVFSTLFALNLSFIRHIASAYRVARVPAKTSRRVSESSTKSN